MAGERRLFPGRHAGRIPLSRRAKVAVYIVAFAVQIAVYTVLFHHLYPLLEGKPITWPNALLFVLETVTTVGYGDLLPFENQFTVAFTILMMATGIIQIFMVIPLLLVPLVQSRLQPVPPRRVPPELSGHILVVGASPTARAIVESLHVSGLPVAMVVDDAETALSLVESGERHVHVVFGDYHDHGTWAGARVKYARDIVICEDEETTASIILGIRPGTRGRVIAVVDKLSYGRYLRYAGADLVLSPKHVTGQILARHVTLTSHLDTLVEETVVEGNGSTPGPPGGETLRIINIPVLAGSPAAGKRLGDLGLLERFGTECLLVARRGHFTLFPGPGEVLDTSTMLFLLTPTGRIGPMVTELFVPAEEKEFLGVICGFGDVGRSAYRELASLGMECMVIDRRPYPVNSVVGSAEDEATLREARIEDADFCIVALNDDSRNILATLMARNLNPRLRILARANEAAAVEKLSRAGADYVALLPRIGGQIIAGVILAPTVYILLSLPDGQLVVRGQFRRDEPSTVGRVERETGVTVLGLAGKGGSIVRPGKETPVSPGDTLIVIGHQKSLSGFVRFVPGGVR
ncbi:MAG: NAD-binding protein [Methanolinea sp.]|nr:NAD-binding protein [Methanolinea sp.]